MQDNELLNQLQRMRQCLDDIESARQMVDRNVQAFNGTSTEIATYSSRLAELTESINDIISTINNNTGTLSSEIDRQIDFFGQEINRIASEANSNINEISNLAGQLLSSSSEELKKVTNRLDTCINRIIEEDDKHKKEIHKAITLSTIIICVNILICLIIQIFVR